MSVQNREVSHLCQVGLMAAMTATVLVAIGPSKAAAPVVSLGVGGAICFGYGMTLLSFMSFPRLRRSDLCALAVIFTALRTLLTFAFHHEARLDMLLGEDCGALVAFASTHLEGFRSAVRSTPRDNFSLRRASERRQRIRRSSGTERRDGRARSLTA